MKKEIIKPILEAVEKEYQMGGLSDGLYGDYASEVAKRYASVELSSLQEKYNKLRAAYENLINRSIDHLTINPLTEKSKFELRQRLLLEAGLKEQ